MKEKIIEILKEVYDHGVESGTYLMSSLPEKYAPYTFEYYISSKDILNKLATLIQPTEPTTEESNKESLIDFFKWLNTFEKLQYTEKGIQFYVDEYLNQPKEEE